MDSTQAPDQAPTWTPAAPGDANAIPQDARTWAMLTHLSALSGFVWPIGFLVGPLIVWLIKRDSHPFVDANGKSAVNFQITMFIAVVVLFIIFLPLFFAGAVRGPMMWNDMEFGMPGWPFFIPFGMVIAAALVMLFELIFVLIAAVRSNDGIHFRYPLAIPFLK